jgi:hypothetical protein
MEVRRFGSLVAAFGLLVLASASAAMAPVPARAAAGCSLDFAVDNPGDWFNVIGYGFRSPPIEFTFAEPVYVWSVAEPNTAINPAVTGFELPPDALDQKAGIFKWTFKTENPALSALDVTVADSTCHASGTANMDPNATFTPQPTRSSAPAPAACIGDYTLYGSSTPGIPPTPTRWFNLFFEEPNGTGTVQLSFDVAVIEWPLLSGTTPMPTPTTNATMPNNSKVAFRTADVGVKKVTITMTSPTCQTVLLVNLNPNAPLTPFPTLPNTATAELTTSSDAQPPLIPIALISATAAGLFVGGRRLSRTRS